VIVILDFDNLPPEAARDLETRRYLNVVSALYSRMEKLSIPTRRAKGQVE
jgi:hypothetical protein